MHLWWRVFSIVERTAHWQKNSNSSFSSIVFTAVALKSWCEPTSVASTRMVSHIDPSIDSSNQWTLSFPELTCEDTPKTSKISSKLPTLRSYIWHVIVCPFSNWVPIVLAFPDDYVRNLWRFRYWVDPCCCLLWVRVAVQQFERVMTWENRLYRHLMELNELKVSRKLSHES